MATYGSIPTSTSPEPGGGGGLEFISRAKDRLRSDLGTRRPWKEMATELNVFSIPSSFSEAISRIKINLTYFRMNYAIIILLILFLSLLWHPISLIVFVLMMSLWFFFYFLRDESLVIFNTTIDDRVVLIVLSVVTIVALFLTQYVTINILVSISVGVFLVLIHAALRKNEDLFLDDDDDHVEDFEQLPLNHHQPSVSS